MLESLKSQKKALARLKMQNNKKRADKRKRFDSKRYTKNSSKSKLSHTYLQLIYPYLLSIKLNIVSHLKSYFDFDTHPFHKINNNIKKHKGEYLHELFAFLFIFFFFVLAFYLGHAITGFTVLSHTSSSDFTGADNVNLLVNHEHNNYLLIK